MRNKVESVSAPDANYNITEADRKWLANAEGKEHKGSVSASGRSYIVEARLPSYDSIISLNLGGQVTTLVGYKWTRVNWPAQVIDVPNSYSSSAMPSATLPLIPIHYVTAHEHGLFTYNVAKLIEHTVASHCETAHATTVDIRIVEVSWVEAFTYQETGIVETNSHCPYTKREVTPRRTLT